MLQVSVNASRSAAVLEYIRAAQREGTAVYTYHDPALVAAGVDEAPSPGARAGTRTGTRVIMRL